jgi:hypothetical protein
MPLGSLRCSLAVLAVALGSLRCSLAVLAVALGSLRCSLAVLAVALGSLRCTGRTASRGAGSRLRRAHAPADAAQGRLAVCAARFAATLVSPAGCAGPTHPLADAAQGRRAISAARQLLGRRAARRPPRLGPRATARPRGPVHPRFHLDPVTPTHRAERCGNAAFGCMGPAQPAFHSASRGFLAGADAGSQSRTRP